MDSIFTLIAFFVIIFIFGTLASWLLPFILPIIISSGLFPYLQEEGMYTFTLIAVHKAKMNNQNQLQNMELLMLNIRNTKKMEITNDLSQQCWI